MAAVMADREAQLQLQQQQQQNLQRGLVDNGETPAGQTVRPKNYTPQVYTVYGELHTVWHEFNPALNRMIVDGKDRLHSVTRNDLHN
jgi:hypothetical protein